MFYRGDRIKILVGLHKDLEGIVNHSRYELTEVKMAFDNKLHVYRDEILKKV